MISNESSSKTAIFDAIEFSQTYYDNPTIHCTGVFVSVKHFLPSLLFTNKARTNQSGASVDPIPLE